MLPAGFKLSNRLLGAPLGYDPNDKDNPGEILALPVWTDGTVCVSLWKASWRERLSMLLFGKVWMQVWYGGSQPPIALTVTRNYLHVTDESTGRKLTRWELFKLWRADRKDCKEAHRAEQRKKRNRDKRAKYVKAAWLRHKERRKE